MKNENKENFLVLLDFKLFASFSVLVWQELSFFHEHSFMSVEEVEEVV